MEKPCVMNRAMASPETTSIAVTGSAPPPVPPTSIDTRLPGPRSACAKPSTATTAAAMTSRTRKTPVIQALARRSSSPARVASSMTPAPASEGSRCRTGSR
ncbi:hypothetical protein GCM10010310_29940 [Streptomyces violaceolatus]|uniref:Uncharacterized protein n=1 Tax=Streptomyces violaceolatus TaxID=67378 RepID=A0ABN3SS56_9ACTN